MGYVRLILRLPWAWVLGRSFPWLTVSPFQAYRNSNSNWSSFMLNELLGCYRCAI